MRRRLTLLALAVTSLVVVAFTVPLAALVAREADAAARRGAETTAQSVAANLVRLAAVDGVDALRESVPPLPDRVGLVFPDGTSAGSVTTAGSNLAATAAAQQRSVATYTAEGWELALPVLTRDGAVVVSISVAREELRRGVARAWLLLGVLGLALIGVALLLAERLGRSLTRSVAELGAAARNLAAGDLSTRVAVADPPELRAVAEAFNRMAPRLEALIEEEREGVADLSHALRTPLTRLKLQIERVEQPEVRQTLVEHLDRMQKAVDELIAEARRRPEGYDAGVTDLAGFLLDRAGFWRVLADEQGRAFRVDVSVPPDTAIGLGPRDLTAALDAVFGNVFDHTPDGTPFALTAVLDGHRAVVTVSDDGPGFPEEIDPTERGVSGGGSTGLGLDIVRRTVLRAGGAIQIGSGPIGGASVTLELPVAGRVA